MSPVRQPDELVMFIARVIGDNALVYKGVSLEFYYASYALDLVEIGDTVRCIFVPITQQIFVEEKIS